MQNLNDFVLFAKVVEHNGFTAASRQLGMPKSRLSRRIAALEERLGVRLIQRSSRHLSVTAVGQAFYERCQLLAALGDAAVEVIEQAAAAPRGALRVSCPMTLAQFWLTPLLPKFLNAYPQILLRLEVTNRRVDPFEERIDVALRVRRPPFEDSSLVMRRIGRTRDVLVASPGLVAGMGVPSSPRDLNGWPTLSLPDDRERHIWTISNGTVDAEIVHEPRLTTADMYALKRAAVDGLGVGLLPELICREELQQGKLLVVLPGWGCPESDIQAVFPSRRGMLPGVRAFVDFLLQHQEF